MGPTRLNILSITYRRQLFIESVSSFCDIFTPSIDVFPNIIPFAAASTTLSTNDFTNTFPLLSTSVSSLEVLVSKINRAVTTFM